MKIWICLKNSFWSKQKNGTNINKKKNSLKNESHTAKLSFSVVLKHFRRNSLKTFLFSQKYDLSQKEAQKYSESLFFIKSLKRGESRG